MSLHGWPDKQVSQEVVVDKPQPQPRRPDRWILSVLWRLGKVRSIVCDPPPGWRDFSGMLEWYGGFLVLESCPLYVREYIVCLHNAKLVEEEFPAVLDDYRCPGCGGLSCNCGESQ